MKKPIIGIVSSMEYVDKGIYKKTVYDVNEDYVDLIYKCNAIPIIIPYLIDFKEIKSFLKNIDGLLLIGGEDVSNKTFNNQISDNKRDNFEIAIYKYFKENHKPILGICRGMQIINVAEGGTLKDIEKNEIEHFIEVDGWINYHNMNINYDSKLHKIINEDKYTVSSVHHQQIDKLGKNIVVSATADDDIIEAIEYKGQTFIIAFQGHIEKCCKNFNKYINVINKFIEEASNEKR